jgi:hypothetical protein
VKRLLALLVAILALVLLTADSCGGGGTSAPGASPADNGAVAAYKAVIQRDMPDLHRAVSKATCADLALCRAEMVDVKAAATRFQNELMLAPDCLKSADLPLTLALEELISGTGEFISGIDQSDSTLMDVGVTDVKSASAHLTTFNDRFAAATC